MAKTKKKIAKKNLIKKSTKVVKKVKAKAVKKEKAKVAKKPAVKKPAVKKAVAKKTTAKKPTAKKAAPAKLAAKKPQAKLAVPKLLGSAELLKALSPLDDRVVVQVEAPEKVTAGGLFIPATVSDVSGNLKGKVVAVGRGHMNKKGHVKPMDVKVGDTVMFSEYAGTKYEFQGVDLLIIRESDVLGIVEK